MISEQRPAVKKPSPHSFCFNMTISTGFISLMWKRAIMSEKLSDGIAGVFWTRLPQFLS